MAKLATPPDWLTEQAQQALGNGAGRRASEKLRRFQEQARKRDVTPTLMQVTGFPQKWYVAAQVFTLEREFVSDMVGIQLFLRNVIMHSRDVAPDDFHLEEFERRLSLVETWIRYFAEDVLAPGNRRHDLQQTIEAPTMAPQRVEPVFPINPGSAGPDEPVHPA